jgi:putative transposase
MPNHWNLVILPIQDGELSRFTGWLTLTHTQRWHAHRHSTGQGHDVYQGRFKSFPIQDDPHFLTAGRYVERNALRANLVAKAQDWKWSSLWRWKRGNAKEKSILSTWPVRRTPNWLDYVNEPQTELELAAIRRSVKRGCPLGVQGCTSKIIERLGLKSTIRLHGTPKNGS